MARQISISDDAHKELRLARAEQERPMKEIASEAILEVLDDE